MKLLEKIGEEGNNPEDFIGVWVRDSSGALGQLDDYFYACDREAPGYYVRVIYGKGGPLPRLVTWSAEDLEFVGDA